MGQSIVIDPVYPVDDYIQKASEIGTKISAVVDTHQHADHVSSAKELAKKTGAIYYQSSAMKIMLVKAKETNKLKMAILLISVKSK